MFFSNKLQKKLLNSKIGVIWQNTLLKRLFIAAGFFIMLTFIIAIDFMPERVSLEQGDVAPRDFKATRSITYIDEDETSRLQKEAVDKVDPVYVREPEVPQVVNNKVIDFITKIKEVQLQKGESPEGAEPKVLKPEEQITLLREKLVFELSDQVLLALVKSDAQTLDTMETRTREIFAEAYGTGIQDDNLAVRKEQLIDEAKQLAFRKEFEEVVIVLIREFTEPNKIYDDEETQRRIAEAQSRVAPVQKSLKQGEIIIREGEIVSREHIVKLQSLGLLKARSSYGSVVGIALIVAIGMTLVLVFLYQINREIFNNEAYLVLTGIIVAITLLLAKVIIAINITGKPEYSTLVSYAVPLSAASMLIAILLDAKLSVIVTIVIGIFLGIMTGGELRFAVMGLITGLISIYSVSRLSQRSDLAKAGFIVGSAGILTIISLGLIDNSSLPLTFLSAIILGLSNGLLAAVLTIGILPYLETAFGITSAIRLLELSNPNNPILKRLLFEAPGTYHHSIIVGNLAEAAAEAIGAESLLARVGAYYHDIGKIKRPYFFIENQLTADNPHDKIAPTLSTLIITSHVKDGLELAEQHKLPQIITDFIEQHHGTTLCSFFYQKAKGDNENCEYNEDDFRYEAKKPQTKETAIVMLADSVEAAVRSMQKPNMGRIEGLVRKLVKEKLHDGQLDESDLTLKEIDKIIDSFMTVLGGIFHSRIEYPDQIEKEIERRKKKSDNPNK